MRMIVCFIIDFMIIDILNVSEYFLSLQQKTAGSMNTALDCSSEGKGLHIFPLKP